MTQESRQLAEVGLAELEIRCHHETRRYQAAQASDTRFCLEIFRRALAHVPGVRVVARPGAESPREGGAATIPSYADEEARATLVRIYSGFITAHINRAATRTTPIDDLVQQAWLRFWRAANNGLEFPSLEAALTYLKRSTISALLEEQRRERARLREVSLQQIVVMSDEATLADTGAEPFGRYTRQRFRARCWELLADPLDLRIFWMRYGVGLAPRDIARELARGGVSVRGRSPTPRAISDVLDRCCKQLSIDPEIRELLRGD